MTHPLNEVNVEHLATISDNLYIQFIHQSHAKYSVIKDHSTLHSFCVVCRNNTNTFFLCSFNIKESRMSLNYIKKIPIRPTVNSPQCLIANVYKI